jgi:hypothetical protein
MTLSNHKYVINDLFDGDSESGRKLQQADVAESGDPLSICPIKHMKDLAAASPLRQASSPRAVMK